MIAFGMDKITDDGSRGSSPFRKVIFPAIVAVAAVAGGAYFIRRSRKAQQMAMKHRLSGWQKKEGIDTVATNDMRLRKNRKLQVVIDRTEELEFLKYAFQNSKPKINFVTGPEGCGKSWLVHEALRSCDYVLKVDLNTAKVSNKEEGAHELLNFIMKKSGYYEPKLHSMLREMGISQRGNPNEVALINKQELENGFFFLENVLKEIATTSDQFPCIFIDEFHSLSEKALKSDYFFRFLQWAVHITDLGLAQIIFCGNDLSLGQLDKIRESFRQRRIHYALNYPVLTPDDIKVVLRNADDGKIFDGKMEAIQLLEAFGGQLKDIEHAIDFVDGGMSIHSTISKMVTETAHVVENLCFTPILDEISKASTPSSLKAGYDKFMRCWNMIGAFSKEETILEDHLVFQVFGDHAHEIDIYEKFGIIRYCWPKLGQSTTHQVTLTPISPRYHKAFQQLVNRPGLTKIVLDVKRNLAIMDLVEQERTLKERIAVITDVKSCLTEEGLSFNVEMAKVWKKLSAIWQSIDELKQPWK